VSESFEPIRSYQRIFRPERRIYQIEGRTLPVPGGVPLRWLAYATAALLAVIAIGSGSTAVPLLAATICTVAGFRVGRGTAAALAAACGFGATWLAALALGLLEWPLRLVVIPAAVATLATQATPDGRRADRFALSWLGARLAPARRSLGRALPAAARPHHVEGNVWVAPDERSPRLRRGRVGGPALVFSSAPLRVRRTGLRARRLVARPAAAAPREGEEVVSRLALAEGEALEVRP
jgi:hypothetical protein